jgi:hypothetical protein
MLIQAHDIQTRLHHRENEGTRSQGNGARFIKECSETKPRMSGRSEMSDTSEISEIPEGAHLEHPTITERHSFR